ncbi:MAG: PKD domain-containing protein [Candidatus Diapherotrites archaeon]|nr:PKD domain-containing protein [Candidatus Diapherotrites archaeon]
MKKLFVFLLCYLLFVPFSFSHLCHNCCDTECLYITSQKCQTDADCKPGESCDIDGYCSGYCTGADSHCEMINGSPECVAGPCHPSSDTYAGRECVGSCLHADRYVHRRYACGNERGLLGYCSGVSWSTYSNFSSCVGENKCKGAECVEGCCALTCKNQALLCYHCYDDYCRFNTVNGVVVIGRVIHGEEYCNTCKHCPNGLCDCNETKETCPQDCGPVCTDECNAGELRCLGSTLQECKDCDSDSCVEWCNYKLCNTKSHCDYNNQRFVRKGCYSSKCTSRYFTGSLYCSSCPNHCGDGKRNCGEECDGNDDSVCPGLCKADCTCGSRPVADANGPYECIRGENVELDGTGSTDANYCPGGGICHSLTYSWTVTNGSWTLPLTGAKSPLICPDVGDYNLQLTVTNPEGSQDVDTSLLHVHPHGGTQANLVVENVELVKPFITGVKTKSVVTVKNRGESQSTSYNLTIVITDENKQVVYSQSSIEKVLPGKKMRKELFEWKPTIPGRYTINTTLYDKLGSSVLNSTITEVSVEGREEYMADEYPNPLVLMFVLLLISVGVFFIKNQRKAFIGF